LPGETPAGHLDEDGLRRLLGYQVAQASVVTLDVFHDAVARPYGLRTVEFTVLSLIRANGAVSPAQLAKALALSPSYITGALDQLQQRGLVLREANEQDRRGQHLHVTPQGAAMADETLQRLLQAEREAFSTLTHAEQAMLAELLHKLARGRTRTSPRRIAPA
jgi:DNA-binding MarR family transcriptional regulator